MQDLIKHPWIIASAMGGVGYSLGRLLWHGIHNPRCRWFGQSVLSGDVNVPGVSLTFDDGPSESTPRLLDLLARYNVPATFFQCGANVLRLPKIAEQVAAAGHELGNHTFSHPYLCFRSRSFLYEQLARTQDVIEDATGCIPRFFRPPFGLRWFGLEGTQNQMHLISILWTTIGFDWMWPAKEVTKHILQNITNGAIICLHDGRRLTHAPDITSTLDAVEALLPMIQSQGFRFVPLVSMIESPSLCLFRERHETRH